MSAKLAIVSRNGVVAASPTPLGETLSPTQCKTFLDCSWRWYAKYALGLPDPPNANLLRGRVLHRMAEIWFRAQLAGAMPEFDELTEPFDLVWEEQCAGAIFSAEDDLCVLKQQAAVLTRKYLDEAAPEIQPAAIELPVSGVIGGVKVNGVVDLLDVNGRIIDLKAPKRTPSAIDAAYAFQLATYRQLMPGASGEVRIDYVVPNKTPKLVTIPYHVSEADIRMTERLYPHVQEGIREGLYFPNRSSQNCSRKTCNFWRECEAQWGGRVKGAED